MTTAIIISVLIAAVCAGIVLVILWIRNMNIGDALSIAFRLITNIVEIQRMVLRVQAVSHDAQVLLPQLLAVIGDGQRVLRDANELLAKIAPEFMPGARLVDTKYDVKWLQTSLNVLTEASLKVDGDYGPQTRAAVARFQTANQLTPDGWAGILTESKIVDLLRQRG
jgi:protein involved in temperature-dependent protein secretion